MPALPASPPFSASAAPSPFLGGVDARRRARDRLLADLPSLYGARAPDAAERLLNIAEAAARARPAALRALDRRRLDDPGWFLREDRIGYSCYVDRFCGGLADLPARLPHLRGLGVTYLHLLPLLRMRAGDNDGGFAVSDFATVDPRFGTGDDLDRAAAVLREEGVTLCLDFVLNHVADDHPWAAAARAGDRAAQARFHIIRDAAEVRALEANLREIFPVTAPGNFTFVPELDGWVWTSFYPFQWDLNYAEPSVLAGVLEALLALANRGVDAFRLDSIPYVWKAAGTASVNRPEAHAVVRVLRTLCDLAAPAVLLKAEAVVATDQMAAYLGGAAEDAREAHLTYQNSLMVALWESLADGHAGAVASLLDRTPAAPSGAGWVNYARCHDDIGWSLLLADEGEAARPRARRLAAFYAGEGGFPRGAPFQAGGTGESLASCGMLASLAGLESATGPGETALALRRIRLLHGLTATLPGMPVIYMGDELGLLNDWAYRERDRFSEDERGLNRPYMNWSALDAPTPAKVLAELTHILAARSRTPQLAAAAAAERIPSGHASVLAVQRGAPGASVLLLANFSGAPVALNGCADPWLPGEDLLSGRAWRAGAPVLLDPYDLVVLTPDDTPGAPLDPNP